MSQSTQQNAFQWLVMREPPKTVMLWRPRARGLPVPSLGYLTPDEVARFSAGLKQVDPEDPLLAPEFRDAIADTLPGLQAAFEAGEQAGKGMVGFTV